MKVRTEARRQAIVEAADALFQEAGYEGATMSEVAKRWGGSKVTLYGYFPSKEALFMAVVESCATGHLADATRELSTAPMSLAGLEAALEHFGVRMLGVLANDKSALAVYRMVVAEAGRSDVGQLFYNAGPRTSVETLAAVLSGAMERGDIRRADPQVTAQQFLALLTAEADVRLYQRNPPPLSPQEIRAMVKRATEMFFAGATPRPTPAG
ncbi:TetR/AcrR family transcriptional regulator [Duganella sp. BJB1802]|uniref:TetR/AcrR family transcriptional regulator n=1 Tax=Duganella sp. BJB1802 TaxID=2744575 RepID=UPI0015932AFD|nr:TetR/AcrR family transcriptional regulator [Duganella sp. BJB1802]NVD70354.1 TetR/AcrR family transcriptional regulator [Duganella sp. BJB1802]